MIGKGCDVGLSFGHSAVRERERERVASCSVVTDK
jgi:hypothetical protein